VPFYEYFEKRRFRILPVTPRRMGVLAKRGQIDAGLFSLVDFLEQRDSLEPLGYGIVTRDQVKSVLLFSRGGWRDLEGKTIGITDDTATSVHLLRVILEKKYGVRARFVRMHTGVNKYREYDAVLLIGDEALKYSRTGLDGFEMIYDLAREWYEWQKLPFVFAVWAIRKGMDPEVKAELAGQIQRALEQGEVDLERIGTAHARAVGLSPEQAVEYLAGFKYRIGEREMEAIELFHGLLKEMEAPAKQGTNG
jgi:chorismate dehydratase